MQGKMYARKNALEQESVRAAIAVSQNVCKEERAPAECARPGMGTTRNIREPEHGTSRNK